MSRRQLSHRNKGSATLGPPRTRIPQQGLAAAGLAVVAFLCYYRTLLPGLDLGDSASFQTIAGTLNLYPRQAYPLYFGLGNLFVWLYPGEPARALNFASATYGAIGVGLASWFAARLSESLLAGIGAGLFLAFSYTFWSQAVTAEVYTLHLMMTGAAGLALISWADRPTPGRLALFYFLFALGFGNHLSMILLLPAFTVFLLMHRRPGAADPLRPRMLIMAAAVAALGALQYAWNFRGLWAELEPPATWVEALAMFWFDVTKADWRETLVMTVSETGLQYRPAMYWFDLRQQFGVPGIALASIGFFYLLWRWPGRAILLLLVYAANLAFAWTYNVGDAYIFFLPSHYVVALSAGAGIAAITALCARVSSQIVATAAGALILVYPAWRGYDTLPAVDRSWDRRAEQLLDEITGNGNSPARPQDAVYGLDANWQLQNAVEYYMRERRPEFPWFITEQLEWLEEGDPVARFNDFVAANAEINRSVVVTERTAGRVSHRSSSPELLDVPPHLMAFSTRVKSVRPGTPYVIAVLRSDQEYSLNTVGFEYAWQWLAPGVMMPTLRQYTAIVGRVGERPVLMESQDRPYRVRVRLEPFDIDVRMESWLPTDTIRRAGFGHVIVSRRHALTLERGLSFVALGPGGATIYDSGLFAPVPMHALRPNPRTPNPQSLIPNP
jgi:hypothetical protein